MPGEAAIYHRTRLYYDLLHHHMRLEEWLELLPNPAHDEREMLKASRRIVMGQESQGPWLDHNDLDHAEEIAELQAFATRSGKPTLEEFLGKSFAKRPEGHIGGDFLFHNQ